MIDTRFYDEPTPLSVDAIVTLIGAEKHRGSGSLMVRHVAPAAKVDVGGLCFVTSAAAAQEVKDEKGIVCLASPDVINDLGRQVAVIVSPHPKRDFGVVIKAMFSPDTLEEGIHPSAHVADTAVIGDGCRIDAGAFIDDGVTLGENCHIGVGAYIGRGCVLGKDCMVEPNVKISHAIIGDGGQFCSGAVIGSTGFGLGDDGDGHMVIPHLGRVVMGDHCHVGANSTIDRGFIDDTVIGNRVMIDNLVMIAHNVVIGDGTIMVAQVGIAGSTTIGENNIFGGKAAAADHLTIGSNNIFTGRCGVTKSVGDNEIYSGFPAVPAREHRRQVATLRRLANPKKEKK